MEKTKILGISGSPRKNGNTFKLVEKALEAARSVPNVETIIYDMSRKKFHHCIGCNKCLEKGVCVFKDDLLDFINLYYKADGIIWGAPVYHLSVPASMKALYDRLGQMLLMHYLKKGMATPRFSKVCGVLTNGAHRNGGQDLTLSFMANSCLMMNCVVVSGDSLAGNYIGASGWTGNTPDPFGLDNSLQDQEGVNSVLTLGTRVAEMATIVKAGIGSLKSSLPSEYFYSWEVEPEKS